MNPGTYPFFLLFPILLSIYFSNNPKNSHIFKQRLSKKGTSPGRLVGGWAIMLTLFFSYSFFQDLSPETQTLLSAPVFLFSFFLLGTIDDLNGMEAEKKLFYQAAILLICLLGFETTTLQTFSLLALGLILINGFNFIDGINGLLPAVSFVYFSQLQGGSPMAAIMLGVFYISRKNRKIYLGDSGSLLLGALFFWGAVVGFGDLGTLALNPRPAILFFLLPVADVFLAIFRRGVFQKGEEKTPKNFFKKISTPDKKHIHHFLKSRYGEDATIVIFILVTWVTTEIASAQLTTF